MLMYNDIKNMIDNIANKKLQESVNKYLDKYRDDFIKCPGSIGHHHAYTGGLVDHTKEVCELTLAIGEISIEYLPEKDLMVDEPELYTPDYVRWNDKLIVSPILHDVGKINQYMFDGYKWVYKMPKEESKTYDHSLWVVNDYRKVIGENLPDDIREAILSHHGGWATNGSDCNTLLGAILHGADLISSRLGK